MKVYYDLHLHSCLSPCGDSDMTPNNIVNMASILGIDMIALTDHNSVKNCTATIEAAKDIGVCVVPGMELCTSEEIHVVCLFPNLEQAILFDSFVSRHSMKIKNRTDIYGEQLILNHKDEVIGSEENLLLLATDISINEVFTLVKDFKGTCFPAHIDRDSYSVIASLGSFPKDCNFYAAEISSKGVVESLKETNPILNDLILLKSSDAHYLENMQQAGPFLELEQKTPEALINALENKNSIWFR